MNAFVQTLMWCTLQVTALAVAALAIGALAGRRRPAAGAWIAAAALTAVVGLTATSMSPWPAWAIDWDRLSLPAIVKLHDTTLEVSDPRSQNRASQVGRTRNEPAGIDHSQIVFATPKSESNHREGQQREQVSAAPGATDSFVARSWNLLILHWRGIAAVSYLLGLAGMGLRFVLGITGASAYRRNSCPIADEQLRALVDSLRAELDCTQEIDLRETSQLGTPATIGWRRPILLLPEDWRSWSHDEQRAALAHEIEHVRRKDYSSWIIAQIGVALHFYHPLVHALAGRLRLQQELAADAAAARVVGGQRKYVSTLATMALRNSGSPVAWPARAFLPTSTTFSRRVEMLHRSEPLRREIPSALLFLSLASVALATVGAAGIRRPGPGETQAVVAAPAKCPCLTKLAPFPSIGQIGMAGRARFNPDNFRFRTPAMQESLDGQFAVALADGSVRRLYSEGAEDRLKWLALPNGGQSVQVTTTCRFSSHVLNLTLFLPRNGFNDRIVGKSRKNLRTLASAMNDSRHGHGDFSLAAVLSPEGQTTHRCRVEVLPQLNQQVLYERYHRADLWDRESDFNLFSRMPSVFHGHDDDAHSYCSGCFVVVDRGTGFQGTKAISIRQITDGTRNTLLLAECLQKLPRTRPEYIRLNPYGPLWQLGEYFSRRMACVLTDGEYRLLAIEQECDDDLTSLIICGDQCPVS